jgi:hypothetical protein
VRLTRRDRSRPTRDIDLGVSSGGRCWLGRFPDGRLVVSQVAERRVSPTQRRRMLAAARRARRLSRPDVLQPVAIQARSEAVVIWPWLSGGSVARRLRRQGPPDSEWGADIADRVSHTIAEMHRRGVVHGALDASHVLLDEGGGPILIGLDPTAHATPASRDRDCHAVDRLTCELTGNHSSEPRPEFEDDAPSASPEPSLRLQRVRPRPWSRRTPVVIGLLLIAAGAFKAGTADDGDPPCVATRAGTHSADVDGDGCAEILRWSTANGRLTAEVGEEVFLWDLGRPGDRFLVKDWNCDGQATPGLHRPSTGQNYAFDRWPTEGATSARAVAEDPGC